MGEIASQSIKRVTLELGGKSANVVFADADLEKAAASAPLAVFGNAGQDCCARSRILVERSAVEPFLEALEREVKALRVGDPLDDATQMGPLISADHREKVASYVDDGRAGRLPRLGARRAGLLVPADRPLAGLERRPRRARGDLRPGRRRSFPFDDEADAIRIANDTVYGLSGSIWTRDGARALRVARALETGNISVNSNSSVRVTTPFGGFKQSGVGRELGPFALEHYTELKNVFISTAGQSWVGSSYRNSSRSTGSWRTPAAPRAWSAEAGPSSSTGARTETSSSWTR